MMQGVRVDELPVRRETGVVPVFDVIALDLVASAVGTLAIAARLVVAAVRQEFVSDPAVIGDPHADIRVLVDVALAGSIPRMWSGRRSPRWRTCGGRLRSRERRDDTETHECALGDEPDTVLMRGGSAIIDPLGNVLAGPDFSGETILYAELDLDQVLRGKFDFDVSGHYARPDIFQLTVDDRPKHAVSAVTSIASTQR